MNTSVTDLLTPLMPLLAASEENLITLEKYKNLLSTGNRKANLVSDDSLHEFYVRHVLDVLYVLKHNLAWADSRIVDVGTGAGIPGLIIKIMAKTGDMLLLESRRKRLDFLEDTLNTLSIQGVSIFKGRAEEAGRLPQYRACFDIALCRALGSLSEMIELSLPLLKVGGSLAAYKSDSQRNEIDSAENALRETGGSIEEIMEYSLDPINSKRIIVFIKKTQETKDRYPRRDGMPHKRPL